MSQPNIQDELETARQEALKSFVKMIQEDEEFLSEYTEFDEWFNEIYS